MLCLACADVEYVWHLVDIPFLFRLIDEIRFLLDHIDRILMPLHFLDKRIVSQDWFAEWIHFLPSRRLNLRQRIKRLLGSFRILHRIVDFFVIVPELHITALAIGLEGRRILNDHLHLPGLFLKPRLVLATQHHVHAGIKPARHSEVSLREDGLYFRLLSKQW